VLAPGVTALGDNPDSNKELFFFTTKVIEIGDFFLWHYGLFHGIFKDTCNDDDGNVFDNNDDDDEVDSDGFIVDYQDDYLLAQQLSKNLNETQEWERSRAMLLPCDVAKPGKRACAKIVPSVNKKNKLNGPAEISEAAPSESTGILPTPASASCDTTATAGANEQARAERRRKAQESAQEEQELVRLNAAARFKSGDLAFVPTASPETSARLTNSAAAEQQKPSSIVDRENDDAAGIADDDAGSISSESEGRGFTNESRIEAEEDQKVSVNLSIMEAAEIWDILFCNKKMKGGNLARSLFVAARDVDSKICEPWMGSKSVANLRVKEVCDQRKLFLQWGGDPRVLKWIRNTIFSIIIARPQTFKLWIVEHADFPRKQGDDKGAKLAALEATDDTMARIAHLACDSECRNLLHMIHGSKTREYVDSHDLQAPQLWQDLADQFINNPKWEVKDLQVAQLEYMKVSPDGRTERSKRIDAAMCPNPGVNGECVRETFSQLKGFFKTLSNAVFGRTGCNSTGEELYGAVWKYYINGKFIHFPRPAVTMYLFKLWNECECLPKYCIKELNPEAAVRVGVASTPFSFPTTPRSSGSSAILSPNLCGTGTTPSTLSTLSSNTAAIDKLANYLDLDRKIKIEEMQKPKVLLTCLFQ
jgi:hypothetical protein